MKKKISLVQMAVSIGKPDVNFARAVELMEAAMVDNPDVIVLPETLNVGFFPDAELMDLADVDGRDTKRVFGSFAAQNGVNVVAGSVANRRGAKVYNTAFVFDRTGNCVCEYDKVHGFSPAREHEFFAAGCEAVNFVLDDVPCGIVICYDIRFPELVRKLALRGTDLLFVVAQWPLIRREHWITLNKARAIENQMYVCAVNGCGTDKKIKYGGNSLLISPWGEEIIHMDTEEEVVTGEIDLAIVNEIRTKINVFRDRREEAYR